MEVDEMIVVTESAIELLRQKLYMEAERHYDNFIYHPQRGVDKIDQYANMYAKEDLKVIAKLEEMLELLESVF
jgi:hypothetical protein